MRRVMHDRVSGHWTSPLPCGFRWYFIGRFAISPVIQTYHTYASE